VQPLEIKEPTDNSAFVKGPNDGQVVGPDYSQPGRLALPILVGMRVTLTENALAADMVCGITRLAHISLVYVLLEELSELVLVLG
jgi:hypothetical protein